MTPTELLLLLQTVIMFATIVVLILYTLETRKLRSAANNQLAVMQRTLGLELQRDKQAAQPIFVWGGGLKDQHILRWDFINEGGPVSHLTITIQSPSGAPTGVEATITPSEWLGASRRGVVEFKGNVADEIRFTIGFQTRIGSVAGFFFLTAHGARPIFTGWGEM